MQRRSRDKNVRTFEFMMRNERQIREAVEEVRRKNNGHIGRAPAGRAHISDPTATEAIRNAEEIRYVDLPGGGRIEWPERWLKVINAVREWCKSDYLRREILRRRYSGESWVSTCAKLELPKQRHLSESKYHRVVAGICNYAIKCAAQVQVVKIF